MTVTEGNTGTVNATFTVSLDAASGQTVTVDSATADGTARRPATTTARTGTLTFTPGQTTQTVTVLVKGDCSTRPTRPSSSTSRAPTNATIADGQGVGTITDDDARRPSRSTT